MHSMHQIPGHDPGHGPASSSNRALLERPEWHWPKAARKPSSSSNDRRRDLAEPDLALAEALALPIRVSFTGFHWDERHARNVCFRRSGAPALSRSPVFWGIAGRRSYIE